MARAAVGGWFRLAGSTGDELVSASESSFALSSYADLAADGATTRGYTVTARSAPAAALAGKSATVATETITVSLSNSYVTVSAAAVAANTDVTVTVTLRDASNRPIPDIDVSRLTTTSSGTGNTFGAWSGRTDQQGRVSRTFQSSVSEAKTITATAFGQTITATGSVTVGTPSAGLFASKWDAATGTGGTAVTDGGLWNQHYDCSRTDVLEVVTNSGLGWTRTNNVLQVKYGAVDTACGAVEWRDGLTAGQNHYGRLFYRRANQSYNGALHNFNYNFVGSIQAVFFNPNAQSASGWRVDLGLSSPWPNNLWQLQTALGSDPLNPPWALLDYDTWYLYEWHVQFFNSNTQYRLWPRISTLTGALLYDASNFYKTGNPTQGTETLQEWYDAGNYHSVGDIALWRRIGLGNEGRSGGPTNSNMHYVADVKVGTGGWLGTGA